jgi:hypothetical protein
MFATVSIPFAEFQSLPTAQDRWLLTCLVRYCNKAGEGFPSLRQLGQDAGVSEATACRVMQRLNAFGVFVERVRRGNGRYRYQIAERFRPRWPGADRLAGRQSGLAQPARQESKTIKHEEAPRWRGRFANRGLSFSEMPDERAKWDARLRGWQTKRFWLPLWGPKPTEAGCFAPLAALQPPQR